MLIKTDGLITARQTVYTPGFIRIEGSCITRIGTSLSTAGERVFDFTRSGGFTVVIPGLIDCHCHLELTGLAGKIRFREGQSLLNWLMKIVLLRPKRAATQARWVKAGSVQSLSAGTTTVADISANNRSWRTLIDLPQRNVCFAEVLGYGKSAQRAWESLQERIGEMPEQREGFWKAISPHAPYSTDERVYRQAIDWAKRHHWPLMTHLSEDRDEVEFIRTGKGPWRTVLKSLGLWNPKYLTLARSPIEWANRIGVLNYPSLLAHVNYADDADIDLLSKGQASVAFCPLAHRYFHHPPHRYRDMLAAGVNVVLGSDSRGCSPTLSILEAMKLIYQSGGMPSETVLHMATIQAAYALGLSRHLGSLEVGKWADLVILRVDRKPRGNLHSAILEQGTCIAAVFIGGKLFYNSPTLLLPRETDEHTIKSLRNGNHARRGG